MWGNVSVSVWAATVSSVLVGYLMIACYLFFWRTLIEAEYLGTCLFCHISCVNRQRIIWPFSLNHQAKRAVWRLSPASISPLSLSDCNLTCQDVDGTERRGRQSCDTCLHLSVLLSWLMKQSETIDSLINTCASISPKPHLQWKDMDCLSSFKWNRLLLVSYGLKE